MGPHSGPERHGRLGVRSRPLAGQPKRLRTGPAGPEIACAVSLFFLISKNVYFRQSSPPRQRGIRIVETRKIGSIPVYFSAPLDGVGMQSARSVPPPLK